MTTVEPSTTELGDVLAELRALRATVDRQQDEIEQLRAVPATTSELRRPGAPAPVPTRAPVNRRAMLGLAGAGVAGVALVGGASSAAAAPSIGNGQPVETGGVNVANTTTEVNVVPTGAPTGVPGEPGFNALLGRTGVGNGSHSVLGSTAGTGHAIAGVTPNLTNVVATTWGRGGHLGPAVEGEQINTSGIPLAGEGNGVKGIIYTGTKTALAPSPNHSHAVLGVTTGGGHAVAGETPALATSHDATGSNKVAATWGKHGGRGPGVEGEQNTTETVALAGGANAVKGIIFNGPKATPAGSPNGSHAVLGVTYGAGHSIAGDTPALALGPNGTGVNTVAATWGRHNGIGAGIGGISVNGYGGEFQGGLAPLHLSPAATAGAPTTGTHKVGELYVDSAGNLYFCTVAGAPGTFTQLNGQSGGGGNTLVLLPTPQRAYDSRPTQPNGGGVKGKTTAGEVRAIDLTANTDLPASVAGVMVNLTVTETVGVGYLSLFAGPTPASVMFSSLNWFASNQKLANQVTSRVEGGTVKVWAQAPTHFIIDVVGYYEGAMS